MEIRNYNFHSTFANFERHRLLGHPSKTAGSSPPQLFSASSSLRVPIRKEEAGWCLNYHSIDSLWSSFWAEEGGVVALRLMHSNSGVVDLPLGSREITILWVLNSSWQNWFGTDSLKKDMWLRNPKQSIASSLRRLKIGAATNFIFTFQHCTTIYFQRLPLSIWCLPVHLWIHFAKYLSSAAPLRICGRVSTRHMLPPS